jgi:hypothetical protein
MFRVNLITITNKLIDTIFEREKKKIFKKIKAIYNPFPACLRQCFYFQTLRLALHKDTHK